MSCVLPKSFSREEVYWKIKGCIGHLEQILSFHLDQLYFYHEELNCGRDVHEPQWSLVLLLISAVENGVDVGRLVDAGDEPTESDEDESSSGETTEDDQGYDNEQEMD